MALGERRARLTRSGPPSGLLARHPAARAAGRAIVAHHLLAGRETVVVAVSGGADSVFLLLVLQALAQRLRACVHVAHLDHGWRGLEAAEAAAFTQALARRLALPFHTDRVDAPQLARSAHLAPEDASRRLRYAFLVDVCRRTGASVVATGHTQDDQLETSLLALLRGSGLSGLAAMSWSGALPAPGAADVRVVRPLLGTSRADIRSALREVHEAWREDSTNADPRLLRNRIRGELVPLLEALAPGFRGSMLRSIELARQAHAFVEAEAHRATTRLFIQQHTRAFTASRRAFCALDPALQGEVLRCAVRLAQGRVTGLEQMHVQGALDMIEGGRGGATAWLTPLLRLRLARGQLVLEPARLEEAAPA